MPRVTVAQSGGLQLQVDSSSGDFVIHDTETRKTYVEPEFLKQTDLLAFYLIAATKQGTSLDFPTMFGLTEE